jgi:hypothetical protein
MATKADIRKIMSSGKECGHSLQTRRGKEHVTLESAEKITTLPKL